MDHAHWTQWHKVTAHIETEDEHLEDTKWQNTNYENNLHLIPIYINYRSNFKHLEH